MAAHPTKKEEQTARALAQVLISGVDDESMNDEFSFNYAAGEIPYPCSLPFVIRPLSNDQISNIKLMAHIKYLTPLPELHFISREGFPVSHDVLIAERLDNELCGLKAYLAKYGQDVADFLRKCRDWTDVLAYSLHYNRLVNILVCSGQYDNMVKIYNSELADVYQDPSRKFLPYSIAHSSILKK